MSASGREWTHRHTLESNNDDNRDQYIYIRVKLYTCKVRHIHMGWLRPVGSIEFKVSFAEYCLFCGALLQKRPIILSIVLTKATPYPHQGVNGRIDIRSTVFNLCETI